MMYMPAAAAFIYGNQLVYMNRFERQDLDGYLFRCPRCGCRGLLNSKTHPIRLTPDTGSINVDTPISCKCGLNILIEQGKAKPAADPVKVAAAVAAHVQEKEAQKHGKTTWPPKPDRRLPEE